jgi:hypothetical protein
LVPAEHLTGGDAEEETVTDVSGSAGDRHADGFLRCHETLQRVVLSAFGRLLDPVDSLSVDRFDRSVQGGEGGV